MAKLAWILGGGTGLGAETAKQLIAQGWTVAISGRREQPLMALKRSHGAHPYPLDVTDKDAVDATIKRIIADHGRIDLMIYSVARKQTVPPGDYDYARYAAIIDTNLLGAMRVIDPVVAHMRAQGGGQIALVASVAGYFGLPRASAYSSGKAAIITLAETMRTELEPDNIDVRVICPGFVRTEFTASNSFPMPFLMEADEAGRRIADGLLNSKRFEIAFPKRFVTLLKTARLLPYPIFFRVMKRLAKL